MDDYRAFAQQYAQGGIKASILLNAGAAVAVLSQAVDLIDRGITSELHLAMILWVVGMLCASLVWVCGFLSTRAYDESVRQSRDGLRHWSNWVMVFGLVLIIASLGCFAGGCWSLANGLLVDATVQPT